MKFTIVTPTLKRHRYLDETIKSVVSQPGDFEIEYIIQDGGSDRGVLEILERWKQQIRSGEFKPGCKKLTFDYFVEPDSGMYDAINKGFEKSTGDILAWINSDDMYFPNAFVAVDQALKTNGSVAWVIGKGARYNSSGSVTFVSTFPNAYSQEFIRRGYYRSGLSRFSWLSQDSIFWRRSLWDVAGPLETGHKLVADFELWRAFSKHADLVKIETLIGGYRAHGDQLTGEPTAYRAELGEKPAIPLRLHLVYSFFRAMPFMRRFFISKFSRSVLAAIAGVSAEAVVGRKLEWDAPSQSWRLSKQSVFP
jgi:glycosyltransferase involved in cell wall biosynthesis